MGKEDRDWYRGEHPPTCNCADCTRRRTYGDERRREREDAERRAKEEQKRKKREQQWEDYYEILDVSAEANDEEIKKAYRDKCFIFHPDRMEGAPESAQRKAEEELKRVNRAFDVLKDPAKRRDYHQEWLRRQHKPPYEAPRPPPPPPPSPADIVLRDFSISPQQIQLGSSATVSVTASNRGGSVGSKTIAMLGDFTQSQTVTLNPGASTIVRFTITPDRIGTFNVAVGRFTGSFSVTAGRRQPTQPVPAPTKPTRRLALSAKWLGGLLVLALVIGLTTQFWPMSSPTREPTPLGSDGNSGHQTLHAASDPA